MLKSDKSLVSIIVPVYNVEKYLDECIDSIVNQSYSNLEIILVDDASTDSSRSRIDEWATKDSRIIVIHHLKNKGINMARKTGFDASHGKYVTFIDSDDFFHQDNIKDTLGILCKNMSDAVIYGSKEFSDQNRDRLMSENLNYEEKLITGKKNIAQYAFFGDGNISGIKHMTVWGKLYKRSVIESVDWRASNFRAYEDNFWTPQALLMSNKIVLMSCPLIYYRRNVAYGFTGNSLSNKLTGNSIYGKAVGYLEYLEKLQEFYRNLAHKYGIESKLDEQIYQYILLSKTWRIDNLVRAGLLNSENNMQYVLRDLSKYIEAKNRHIDNLDHSILELNQKLAKIENHNAQLSKRMEELSGVKLSAKLLVGNVKRKVKGYFS